jgi:hypothetical protein
MQLIPSGGFQEFQIAGVINVAVAVEMEAVNGYGRCHARGLLRG